MNKPVRENLSDSSVNSVLNVSALSPWCEMTFFSGLKKLFFHPSNFFECIREEGLKPAFFTFLLFSVITGIVEAVIAYLVDGIYSGSLILSLLFEGGAIDKIIFLVMVKWLVVLAGSFILSGIFYLVLKLLKGQGSYVDTYKVFAYSLIPLLLIGLIPWIGILGLVYTLVLLVVGLPKVHNISRLKVGLSISITWLVLSVVSFLVGAMLIESLEITSIALFVLLTPWL